MIDVVEILQHWYAGRPKAVVAASLDIDPKTVRKYVKPAEAAGFAPGGPPVSRAEWSQLVIEWFPELTDPRHRSKAFVKIDEHRETIEKMIETNTVTTVHQRLRDEHGLAVGITSFRDYVASEFPDKAQRERVTVLRPEVPPGAEAQVDYGLLGRWFDPALGRFRRVWAFVMVLSASRHMFVRPVFKMDQAAWVAAHVAAFEYFGGVPARIVPDNLSTGVAKADLYDPKINRAYGELADYYGFIVDPARVSHPKDKPRVERPMPYVRDSYWRGREWVSPAHMETAAISWCSDVAGQRHHRSLDGASPASVFHAVEAAALSALPPDPFEICDWSRPKVGPDCHVKVSKALYSLPWRFIGRQVDARESERTVQFFIDSTLVRTWTRIDKGRQTNWDDYPPEKVAFFMRTPTWCRKRAEEIGEATAETVGELLSVNALHKLRSAQGVIRLADKYGTDRLEAACRRALVAGDPSYKTVKGILAIGAEAEEVTAVSVPTAPAHLHGPDRLFLVGESAS